MCRAGGTQGVNHLPLQSQRTILHCRCNGGRERATAGRLLLIHPALTPAITPPTHPPVRPSTVTIAPAWKLSSVSYSTVRYQLRALLLCISRSGCSIHTIHQRGETQRRKLLYKPWYKPLNRYRIAAYRLSRQIMRLLPDQVAAASQ